MRNSQSSVMMSGRRILCHYVDEPMWRERLLLQRVGSDQGLWAICTPDGDVYVENYRDESMVESIRVVPTGGGRPSGCVGKIYPFRNVPSAADTARWKREGAAAAAAHAAGPTAPTLPALGDGAALVDDEDDGASTPVAPVRSRRPGKGLSRRPSSVDADGLDSEADAALGPTNFAPPGNIYFAVTGTSSVIVGDKLPDNCEVRVGFEQNHFYMDGLGEVGMCTAQSSNVREKRKFWRGKFSKVAEVLYDSEAEDDDVRILPVLLGRDKRRHRRLEECEMMYYEDDFWDWPLEGGRGLSNAAREMSRANLTWLTHHDNWRTRSGINANSRSVHEHCALCRILHWLTVYDQLNLVNSAGAECANMRRELIEHAHDRHPDAPDWSGADDFMGLPASSGGAIVNPARLNYVAGRQGARAKVMENVRKAREETASFLRRGKGDNAEKNVDGEKAKKGKDKSGGRGDGGQQAG